MVISGQFGRGKKGGRRQMSKKGQIQKRKRECQKRGQAPNVLPILINGVDLVYIFTFLRTELVSFY